LPLAHIFETALVTALILFGGSVGFYQGDVRKLVDDITALRPTILVGVPRVWTRIYDKVQAGVRNSGWLKRTIFETAYGYQVGAPLEGLRSSQRMRGTADFLTRPLHRMTLAGGEHSQRLPQSHLGRDHL
jgi:long-chain acyl-CoA synthetase